MKPILFAPSATSFITNGIGRLSDAPTGKVIEELNSEYELEMTYPMGGKYFDEIRNSSIIVAKPSQSGSLQAFRVYKISKPAKGIITAYARHITYQLNYIPCGKFSGQSCSAVMNNIKTAVAEYCPFNFYTDIVNNITATSQNLLNDTKTECGNASGYIDYTTSQFMLDLEGTRHYVWLKCEKNKKYIIEKKKGATFGVATTTVQPTSSNTSCYNIVQDNTATRLEYTTSDTAEYLVLYIFSEEVDTTVTYEEVITSMSIKSVGTYTWMLNEPKTIRSFLLGSDDSIQKIYGGEFEWDNYNVRLLQNRGSDKGVVIRYGKNLIDLTQEENIENTITGIYPIWKSDEALVELPEKVIHAPNADKFPFYRTEIHDFTSDFDSMPSVEELREMANLYIQKEEIGVPEVNLKVNFVNLSETEEYKDILALQTVSIGDMVTVEFPALGVSTKQKVTKTEYDFLNERYTSVTIGNSVHTLADTIEQQMNELSEKVSQEESKNSIDRATGVMNAGRRGHVIISRNEDGFANEMYFLDNENAALAKNVLRINVNGIGFSGTGVRGPYYQAWTLDGHMSLGGINNNHGTFEILDSTGKVIGKWDNESLYVEGGKIVGGQFRTKNGEFYAMENGNDVEVGWSGWFVERTRMLSNWLGWQTNDNVNPATFNSSSAAINGGCQAESMDGCDEDDGEGNTSSSRDPDAYMLGQYGQGNIDLYNRPQYVNGDGSISTVRSISFGTDEGEILIPTIGFGYHGVAVKWTDDEAIDHYYETGEYLGKFATVEEATAYADLLHRQQEAYYNTNSSGSGSESSGDGASSSTDGYPGTAAFKALWLDDPWFEGRSSDWSYTQEGRSQHHLWDVAETLQWLDSRITTIENECWQHCDCHGGEGDDCDTCDGEGGCSGEGDICGSEAVDSSCEEC